MNSDHPAYVGEHFAALLQGMTEAQVKGLTQNSLDARLT